MDNNALQGITILVAEDEYMLATDLAKELANAGSRVLGPVPSLDAALDLIDAADKIHAAILDVSLQDEKVFPAADMLAAKGVPFLFATGYDQSLIPPRFSEVLRCEKPIGAVSLIRAVRTIIEKAGS